MLVVKYFTNLSGFSHEVDNAEKRAIVTSARPQHCGAGPTVRARCNRGRVKGSHRTECVGTYFALVTGVPGPSPAGVGYGPSVLGIPSTTVVSSAEVAHEDAAASPSSAQGTGDTACAALCSEVRPLRG